MVRILLLITAIVFLSVLIPKYTIYDSDNINEEERICAIRGTHQILDNPIEQLLIFKTVTEKKEGNTIYTGSYTFFGLKYAEVKLVCNKRSQVIWRRWFVNSQ